MSLKEEYTITQERTQERYEQKPHLDWPKDMDNWVSDEEDLDESGFVGEGTGGVGEWQSVGRGRRRTFGRWASFREQRIELGCVALRSCYPRTRSRLGHNCSWSWGRTYRAGSGESGTSCSELRPCGWGSSIKRYQGEGWPVCGLSCGKMGLIGLVRWEFVDGWSGG